jgi:glucose/mannose-6-phosphate isomerase
MAMEDAIKNFASQFNFKPIIENESKLKRFDSFVLCGMGGSHLAADLLKIFNPAIDMYVHRDYGLPQLSEKRFKNSMYIASSYSGNTEEVIDFAEKALEAKYAVAVIATGGALIEFAKAHTLPYVLMPNAGIQPRSALGFSLLALTALIGDSETFVELQKLESKLAPMQFQEQGKALAQDLAGKIPVIYSSRANTAVGYNWKIKCNETAKIPAFSNVFPELNHNEMTGFDVIDSTKKLSEHFHFIFIADADDSPNIMRRMEVLAELYDKRGLRVEILQLTGQSVFEKVFNSLLLADWTALSLSALYTTEPEKVPLVEEFKKLIA